MRRLSPKARLSPQAAREWSRAVLNSGVVTALGTILYFVLTVVFGVGASFTHPFYDEDLEVMKSFTSWVGLAMALSGLAWMVRIYRRDPDGGPSPWRYREWG